VWLSVVHQANEDTHNQIEQLGRSTANEDTSK